MTEPEFPMPGEGPFFTEYLADIQSSFTPVVDDSTTPPTIRGVLFAFSEKPTRMASPG